MIDLRASQKKEQLELKKLMSAEEPNKKKIHAQIDKISAVEAKIHKSRIDHRLAVREILTADQLKIYQQAKFHRGERGDCEHPRKPGRGDGQNFPHRRF